MIPKIIHYCWLSDDPIPENLQECMKSWQKYLPSYEFRKWDFKRFPHGKSQWVDEAFANKKYAFAADYIRIYALYNYGGIYLDMDVEVLKPFDDLLKREDFICYESESSVPEVAAFGVAPHRFWLKEWLAYYEDRHFVKSNGEFDTVTLPIILDSVLKRNGWHWISVAENQPKEHSIHEIEIFPSDYFSPKSYKDGKIRKTENTYCIHHFSGSWHSRLHHIEMKFWQSLGVKNHPMISWHIDRFLCSIGIKR